MLDFKIFGSGTDPISLFIFVVVAVLLLLVLFVVAAVLFKKPNGSVVTHNIADRYVTSDRDEIW